MKKLLFLMASFFAFHGPIFASELLPIDVVERMEGEKEVSYVEFWQVDIQSDKAVAIRVKQQHVPSQNYAEAFVLNSKKIEWITPDTAKVLWDIPTGESTFQIKVRKLLGSKIEIVDIQGTSASTSALSNKTISKMYLLSKTRKHTLNIELPN